MLEVEGLVRHYRDEEDNPILVLDGVTLTIRSGEFVALCGASGSGKSTLLDLVAGFQAPDAGTVTFNGRNIATFSRKERADYRLRALGIVGQPNELLLGASAQDNASLKLLRVDARNANRLVTPLLHQLGLGDRLKQRAGRLSLGERQRVSIAQALALDPKLVLADEPTGHLDPPRSREILELLRSLCRERGTAVLLVSHSPQAVAYADRIHELRDGRLRDYRPETFAYDPGLRTSA
jgi:putative ABC transport system ATP-binding protein